jgi:D-serine deaminase-like pyridoxal phosphate-dependent protein
MMETSWYTVANADEVPSPALLVYPDRVEENIRRMIRIAGGVHRLRPHMKTNKLPEVIRMHLDQGITKFKCATVAEAEMAATCLAPDVLLAYQPVGPNAKRFIQLVRTFPGTRFSALADDEGTIRALSKAAVAADVAVNLLLDLDCGMHRTGVAPGPRAVELYRLIARLPGLSAAGLHAYDGHIHETDPGVRTHASDESFVSVDAMRNGLLDAGLPVPALVVGGTPTFPVHARRPDVECSPGTSVFWDWWYATTLPDLDFLPAVLVLTRVVSKPGTNLLCLDLGHKAVASEVPPPRVHLLGLPDAAMAGHSEEHLVLETNHAGDFPVGACFYGIPWHICPTVALHNEAVVVRNGRADGRWAIVGRARMITI